MTSEVTIANLAASLIGEDATISSIDPPEGSQIATYCEQFYPISRDTLLQAHEWNFCTRRINGAEVTPPDSGWEYAYARPTNCLQVISVLPPGALDDYNTPAPGDTIVLADGSLTSYLPGSGGLLQPQPFACEIDEDGNEQILTNQYQAIIRYTLRITDVSKFPPMVVRALAYLLASDVAGSVVKGEPGIVLSQRLLAISNTWAAKAMFLDARQRKVTPKQNVPWISGR